MIIGKHDMCKQLCKQLCVFVTDIDIIHMCVLVPRTRLLINSAIAQLAWHQKRSCSRQYYKQWKHKISFVWDRAAKITHKLYTTRTCMHNSRLVGVRTCTCVQCVTAVHCVYRSWPPSGWVEQYGSVCYRCICLFHLLYSNWGSWQLSCLPLERSSGN